MQYVFYYLLPFDLWTSYLEMILFLIIKGYSTTNFKIFFLVLQESLMSSSIVYKCGKDPFNVPKSFSYKDYWADFFYHTVLH